ncbi:MAG: UvrD-helicase domain-containing protein, partial [Deltaproteobacteria bacterium]
MNAGTSPDRPHLSERQRACLEPTKNMIVSAGAGSGKTLLLAKKMGDLFCQRSASGSYQGIEQVLALTFTRKAAGELRTRVYGELLDRIGTTGPGPLKAHLRSVTEKFHAARIFTIHGFASGLIRSHPVASATDPDFEILDHAREAVAVRNAIRSTLQRRWTDRDPALVRLLEQWSPFELRATLEYLLRHPIELKELGETADSEDILSLLRNEQALRWAEFRSNVEGPSGWLSR